MSSATTSDSTRLHEELEHAATNEAKPKEPLLADRMDQIILRSEAAIAQLKQMQQEESEHAAADGAEPKEPVLAHPMMQLISEVEAHTAQLKQMQQETHELKRGLRKAQAKFRSKAEKQAAYRELGAMME
ncbi:hypothetical protein LTR28_008779 [Elasticomyces elasticus]|nr:hypothetical protein LTR28_008779 [Elasticomyces elasticus]